MTINVTGTPAAAPQLRVVAQAPDAPAKPVKAADVPKEDPGALGKMGEMLKKTGIEEQVGKAINAKSSDEVVAALTAGIAQLVIERTKIGDLDKKLETDYKGTIQAHVTNETAQKALLALGDIFGDKVASNMISAGVGAVSGTTVELLKDEKFQKMYKEDRSAFGLELAKRSGKNFGVALLAAWGTAKAEEILPAGFKWLAKLDFVQKLLGVFSK